MVCGDPRVLKLLEKFVPAVGSPEDYRQAKKTELEYQLLFRALNESEFGGHRGMERWHVQGLFVISPSGRLLAGRNSVADPDEVVRQMNKGLEEYAKLPRAERLLPRAPDPRTDKIARRFGDVEPPAGGLVLRVVTRGLPFPGVAEDDTRHAFYHKLDRLWYKKEEARQFLPEELRKGAKTEIRDPVRKRLVVFNLGTNFEPSFYWHYENIEEATLTSEVVAVDGERVALRLSGRLRVKAKEPYDRSYDADLLGKATFDRRKERFVGFELLSIGTHTSAARPGHDTGPRSVPLGVYLSLDGEGVNDQVLPFYFWLYGWERP